MGDAEPCYIAHFSPKTLANELERLITKLPPPDAPAEQPARRLPRPSIRQLRHEELTAMITDYQAGAIHAVRLSVHHRRTWTPSVIIRRPLASSARAAREAGVASCRRTP